MIKRFLAISAALCVMTSMASSAFAQGGETDNFTGTPNDILYAGYQWNLEQINMPKVWAKGYRGEGATVCIIDSGLNFEHEDLDESRIVGKYNVFDESENVTDLVGGYIVSDSGMYVEIEGDMVLVDDFIAGGGTITEKTIRYNKKGHGTSVTGVISAVTNNKKGIAGIADKANIIVVKAFDAEHDTDTYKLIDALNYVAERHPEVDVINMSLGTDEAMSDDERNQLKEAIDAVVDMGMIVVAAVGNKGTDAVSYPAGFDNVIGVGGTDYNKVKCDFSQYNESVFVSAPGDHVVDISQGIPSLDNITNDEYYESAGTSMAAPHVSGVAAIAKSIYPELTANQFKEILQKTSEDLIEFPDYFDEELKEQFGDLTGYDPLYGYGLIDAYKVIKEVEQLAENKRNADIYRVLEYVKDSEGASVVVETKDQDASVYIASYNDNVLSFVRRVDISDLESEADDNGNYCRYKIPLSEDDPEPSKLFLWHDMIGYKTWEPQAE